jgi:glucosamine-6-phosphate deaminase
MIQPQLKTVAEFFGDYLTVSPSDLGKGQPIKVRVLGDMASMAGDFAGTMLEEILRAQREGRGGMFIVPVGPVDQFSILARMINEKKISCRDLMFINMDEYLDDDDRWVAEEHPLSFRGYMKRAFYDLIEPMLAPRLENRVFPEPQDTGRVQELIEKRGGVDVCFGGIGINGHVAFNEPPELGEKTSVEEFAMLPTRAVSLARETRTINSVTVGGEISIVPRRAVTVGMREILAAKRLRFYCNRPWQSAVVRRVLHGPVTAECPASLLRQHPDAMITMADYVAAPPNIQLR